MPQTLEKQYAYLREQLKPVTRSPEQASAEALLILENLLGISQAQLYSQGKSLVPKEQWKHVEDFLQQRIEKRIPIQYLLHQAWFYGLKFYVNPHVLIPRPETELLVEQALTLAQPGMRIADIGTGPGTIAITLSHKLGSTMAIYATELCGNALKVAQINQKSLGTQVVFKQGDLLNPLPTDALFDMILSNPPYIDQNLRSGLDAEVVSHEPGLALFSPSTDAAHYYHRLTAEAKPYLKTGGHLIVEVGAGMAQSVLDIFQATGYQQLRVIPDLAGIDRLICGIWQDSSGSR